MKYEAHRGVSSEFPENTMTAFQAAKDRGFDVIELDPYFTKDDQCVVLHDKSLNRTCRLNGEELKEKVQIAEITFAESQTYDAGSNGEKIPLLKDVLQWAKEADIVIKIDNRVENFTPEHQEQVFCIAEESGAKFGFTCKTVDFLKRVAVRFPQAELHYDGYVDEPTVKSIAEYLNDRPFTVWLGLPSELTSWVKVPMANEEICKMVKKYADLGIWILSTEEELAVAKSFNADIIETTGAVTPSK